jgi:hypothetical protein
MARDKVMSPADQFANQTHFDDFLKKTYLALPATVPLSIILSLVSFKLIKKHRSSPFKLFFQLCPYSYLVSVDIQSTILSKYSFNP